MLTSALSNETLSVIRRRRSCRSYSPRQVAQGELNAVLDAALCAPSAGGGADACHLAVVQNRAMLCRLDDAAKDAAAHSGTEHLARLGTAPDFHCLYGAPTLIVVSGRDDSPAPESDVAAAVENMLLAAESLGLGACWIYFVLQAFDAADGGALRETLQIPAGYRPFASVALGYAEAPPAGAPERDASNISFLK